MPSRSRPRLAVLALLFGVAWGLISCALTVSFDDYRTTRVGRPPSGALFGVRGTVAGLEGEQATLLLNGTSLEVTDGPFAFPATLADGVDFEVTVRPPLKHACALDRSKGRIAAADATGVAVACVSRDATLKALSVSVGPLSPAFDAAKLSYEINARIGGVLTAVPTTLTVSATPANPAALVSVDGVTLEAGGRSAPLVVKAGPNVLDIAVVVPSASALHYTVVVNGADFDYVKASDTAQGAAFGAAVALSGVTLAVAGDGEGYVFTRSASTWSQQALMRGVSRSIALDGDTLATGSDSGVSIYVRSGAVWSRQAFDIEPSTGTAYSVAVSGATLAVGCYGGAPASSLSVRIFTRSGAAWAQQGAFVRAGEPQMAPPPLALTGDTLVIGNPYESSGATGIGGDENDTSAPLAGAAYVLGRSGTTWSLQAYVKASNARAGAFHGVGANFGAAVALSGDTLVVGSPGESSAATGVGGDQSNTEAPDAGAAYVFTRAGGVWSQEAYLKGASLTGNLFGASVAVLGDTIAVGAPTYSAFGSSSAVYLFRRAAGLWTTTPRVTPPGGAVGVQCGSSVALASDILAIGASNESSKATGINGDRSDQSLPGAGAVYVH